MLTCSSEVSHVRAERGCGGLPLHARRPLPSRAPRAPAGGDLDPGGRHRRDPGCGRARRIVDHRHARLRGQAPFGVVDEGDMNAIAAAEMRGATVALAAGAMLRLESPRGLQVTCESGHLWITEESQVEDVWLAAGQRVRLVGEGLAVLEAKGNARLRIE